MLFRSRTTLHFAPFTREYIGIDYSKEMINACKKRLEHFPSNIKFEVVNANDLSQFQNESFDFILFSFNGLDYSNEMDRKNVLKGIIRICKPNSIFCFSTHNIQTINHYYAFNFSFNLKHLLKEIYRQYFLRSMNQKKNIKKEFTFFWDGAHNFKLHTYYCNPSFQIKQLSDLGFRNIKVYDLSGNDITNSDKLAATKDAWLYYICEK